MLKLFRKDSLTPQTERIYKVPLCIQDTIPIYRISENGIFELESPTNKDGGKKKIHQFDRMYLFEDINFSTQDEEEKEETGKRFETLLRSMNVSYKVIVSNHYADNGRLRKEILQKAVSKEMEPLAKEYHKLIEKRLQEGRGGLLQSKYFIVSCRKPDYESAKNYFNTIEFSIQQLFHRLGSCLIPLDATERLRALHSYYRIGDEASFSFDWNEYLHLKRDWRNDIINTSLQEIHDDLGYCYGFNKVSKNLIIGNRKLLKNGNGMVFGVPGSGKSYNEKSEMGQAEAPEEVIKSIIRPEIEEGQVLQKKKMWMEMEGKQSAVNNMIGLKETLIAYCEAKRPDLRSKTVAFRF